MISEVHFKAGGLSMSLEGKWITCRKFASLRKQNVFHRQLDHAAHPVFDEDLVNTHVLFRRKFFLDNTENCVIRITADDYYKLYINGKFVTSGPAAGYDFRYFYNEIDLSNWVVAGENTIAVHTYYQGMINRVWVSGDRQHGLLLDLFSGEKLILASDESFRCAVHTGFSAAGTAGYNTQFMERYDAGAPECGFEAPDYDDSAWEYARKRDERFFDLVRWGIAGETMNNYLNAEKDNRIYYVNSTFTKGKDEYYPIPNNQYNYSGGKYVQNPGYASFN